MKKNLQIDGKKVIINVEGAQNGRLLLMLHGWGGNKESWTPLLEELKAMNVLKHRLAVTVDFPGFGESDEPPEAWNVTQYTNFVELLIKQLYKEMNLQGNYDLIVHSFGGRVVLKLLSPDFHHQIVQRPERLVLVAAAGIKPRRTWRLKLTESVAKAGKILVRLPVLNLLAPLARKVLYKALKLHDYEKSSGVMRDTFLKVIEEDLSESLDHIKNPTLIFWGKRDSYIPVRNGELMHRKIPGSKLIVFSDGRHGIHKTKANLLAAEISQFLTAKDVS